MIGTWFLPLDGPTKIQIEVLILVANVASIYLFHQSGMPVNNYPSWGVTFLVGLVIAAIALRIEPVWWKFFLLYAEGQHGEAIRVLNAGPHSNPFLFIGLGVMYASVAGAIRLIFVTAILALKFDQKKVCNNSE